MKKTGLENQKVRKTNTLIHMSIEHILTTHKIPKALLNNFWIKEVD